MTRHREKDEEAGGEGLGRLQTRKRLWRDETGTVVAKRRPELENKIRTSSHSKNIEGSANCGSGDFRTHPQQDLTPISPPGSSQDHHSTGPDIEVPEHSGLPVTGTGPMLIEDVLLDQAGTMPEPYDFLCNASWGSQPQESTNSDLLYNDFFAPDTGL